MTNDELIAEVKALEHRLVELWGWADLMTLGRNLDEAFTDMEPREALSRGVFAELEEKLEAHLSRCFSRALEEIDWTLVKLPPGIMVETILDRLAARLKEMGGRSFAYYLDFAAQPDAGAFNNATGTRSEEEMMRLYDGHIDSLRSGWGYVDKSLRHFVEKVADYIILSRIHTQQPTTPLLDRIQWTCSTQVYVHIVKELLQGGYIAAPDMNGKEGEANITELFRRLSQAFIVTGRKGNELPPDELQRRFDGRPLAAAKALRLTFPEAKEVK